MSDSDRISISLSDDRLEAYVEIAAGPPLEPEKLTARIVAAGIREGLDTAVMDHLARSLELAEPLRGRHRIAEGRAPTPGRAARVEIDLPPIAEAGASREDGSLDYRNLHTLVPVARDERIGRLHPATPGKPGIDVLGDEIAADPPETMEWRHGDGVALLEDGSIVATRTGARTVDREGRLDVVELHTHSGSVDLSSGNLETSGSLSIGRDVTFGMSVRAAHEIRIGGMLDGGTVRAGGSIELTGGALGRDLGELVAGWDVTLRHALSIRIRAGNRIHVKRSVSGSQLCARHVVVDGRILSDSIEAESTIRAGEAASPAGGPCLLRAAMPADAPPVADRPSKKPASMGAGRAKRRKALSGLEHARRGREPASATAGKRAPTASRFEALLDWRARQNRLQRDARIEIVGTAHPGCRIDFGAQPLTLETPVEASLFQLDPETGRVIRSEL